MEYRAPRIVVELMSCSNWASDSLETMIDPAPTLSSSGMTAVQGNSVNQA
jgi:hypothetical protein